MYKSHMRNFAAYETQLKITKLRTGSYRYKVFLLEVPKDAYKAFYREKERERYLRKLDSALFLCNLDLKSEEIPLRDENTDIEQQTEDRLMIEKMYSCLRLLDPDDAEFIRTLPP